MLFSVYLCPVQQVVDIISMNQLAKLLQALEVKFSALPKLEKVDEPVCGCEFVVKLEQEVMLND